MKNWLYGAELVMEFLKGGSLFILLDTNIHIKRCYVLFLLRGVTRQFSVDPTRLAS